MAERQTAVIGGAGPVGLVLALLLARAGVGVTVLEMRDEVNLDAGASTFHAPTLDLLQSLGVLAPMRQEGVRIDHVQYRDCKGAILARTGFGPLSGHTGNPYRLHCEQAKLSVLLRDLLAREKQADIRFDCGVRSVCEDDDGVVVGYGAPGGLTRREIRADYLFGCDGAMSGVREACRIGYVEKPYPGLVARLYADPGLPDIMPGMDGVTHVFDGDDSVSLLRMADCWHIVLRVPPGVSATEAGSDAWLTRRAGALIPIAQILPGVMQRDVHGARRRMALQPRTNRVFLAGDALHLTDMRDGMNLNAGIHDAFALARAAVATVAQGSLAALHRAADDRGRVARDRLLPRTDRNAGTGRERLNHIVALSQDPQKLADFLYSQAMLDMLDGVTMPPPAAHPRHDMVSPESWPDPKPNHPTRRTTT